MSSRNRSLEKTKLSKVLEVLTSILSSKPGCRTTSIFYIKALAKKMMERQKHTIRSKIYKRSTKVIRNAVSICPCLASKRIGIICCQGFQNRIFYKKGKYSVDCCPIWRAPRLRELKLRRLVPCNFLDDSIMRNMAVTFKNGDHAQRTWFSLEINKCAIALKEVNL